MLVGVTPPDRERKLPREVSALLFWDCRIDIDISEVRHVCDALLTDCGWVESAIEDVAPSSFTNAIAVTALLFRVACLLKVCLHNPSGLHLAQEQRNADTMHLLRNRFHDRLGRCVELHS